MQILDRAKASRIGKADFPRLEGRVRVRLHNPTTGKTEIIEGHNIVTNAVADIFANNFGGIVDYDNLLPLYSKMFGGVLCFANELDDTDATDYAIPSASDNAITAHAGQNTYSSAADDLTRGNPNTTGLVLADGSVTQVWEWASSQGNGTVSAIALCHADIGDAGAGGTSNAFQSLDPFIEVACKSRATHPVMGGNVMFAVKDNKAYSFKVSSAGILTLYKTPVVHTKAGLQGNGLIPLTDYTETTTINLNHNFSETLNGDGACLFSYDLDNDTLMIFSVYSTGYTVTPTTLTIDTIDLSAGTATTNTQTINLTGRYLWSNRIFVGGYGYVGISFPMQAIVMDGYLYYPTCDSSETYRPSPNGYIRINLSNFADIDEITNNTGLTTFDATVTGAVAIHGKKAIQDTGLLFDGTNVYKTATHKVGTYNLSRYFTSKGNIAAYDALNNDSLNRAIVSKLYLATKYNLEVPANKTAAQSMSVTYTLREV